MSEPLFGTEEYYLKYPPRTFDSPEDGKELFIPSRPAQSVQSNSQANPIDQRLQESETPINPVQSSGVTQRPLTPEEELIKKLYSTREEAPKIDQDKIDRIRRMGKVNEFGRGLNVLSDALSLGLGANVKRRNPDQISPALYQSYENTLDKYDQENKAFKYRDYQKKLSDIQFGIARLDKETEKEYRNRVQAANEAFRKVKNAQDLAKWQAEFQIDAAKTKETGRHNKEMEKAALIRANKTGQKATKVEKPFMIAGVNGQDVPLTQGQFRDLLAEATRVANESGTNSPQFKDFQATMASFKDNPLEGQKNIVQRYYAWKKEQESLAKNRQAQGLSTEPVKNTLSQPKAQFNPDKAKKFKSVPTGGF